MLLLQQAQSPQEEPLAGECSSDATPGWPRSSGVSPALGEVTHSMRTPSGCRSSLEHNSFLPGKGQGRKLDTFNKC